MALADLWASGVSPEGHPTRFLRGDLDGIGVVTAVAAEDLESKTRCWWPGWSRTANVRPPPGAPRSSTSRTRPGSINVVVSKGCWQRHLTIARSAPALLIRGRVENAENVVNVIAERLEPLPLTSALRSRDFR